VGNGTFLLQQMEKLDQATGAVGTFPLILEDSAAPKIEWYFLFELLL